MVQQMIVAALEPYATELSHAPARDLAATGFDRYLAQVVGVPDDQDQADMAAILAQL